MKYITTILTAVILMFAVSCKKDEAPAKPEKEAAADKKVEVETPKVEDDKAKEETKDE